jgi:hypothetical protein
MEKAGLDYDTPMVSYIANGLLVLFQDEVFNEDHTPVTKDQIRIMTR